MDPPPLGGLSFNYLKFPIPASRPGSSSHYLRGSSTSWQPLFLFGLPFEHYSLRVLSTLPTHAQLILNKTKLLESLHSYYHGSMPVGETNMGFLPFSSLLQRGFHKKNKQHGVLANLWVSFVYHSWNTIWTFRKTRVIRCISNAAKKIHGFLANLQNLRKTYVHSLAWAMHTWVQSYSSRTLLQPFLLPLRAHQPTQQWSGRCTLHVLVPPKTLRVATSCTNVTVRHTLHVLI